MIMNTAAEKPQCHQSSKVTPIDTSKRKGQPLATRDLFAIPYVSRMKYGEYTSMPQIFFERFNT